MVLSQPYALRRASITIFALDLCVRSACVGRNEGSNKNDTQNIF